MPIYSYKLHLWCVLSTCLYSTTWQTSICPCRYDQFIIPLFTACWAAYRMQAVSTASMHLQGAQFITVISINFPHECSFTFLCWPMANIDMHHHKMHTVHPHAIICVFDLHLYNILSDCLFYVCLSSSHGFSVVISSHFSF